MKLIYIVRPKCQPLDIYHIEAYYIIKETKEEYFIMKDDEEITISKKNIHTFEELTEARKQCDELNAGELQYQ